MPSNIEGGAYLSTHAPVAYNAMAAANLCCRVTILPGTTVATFACSLRIGATIVSTRLRICPVNSSIRLTRRQAVSPVRETLPRNSPQALPQLGYEWAAAHTADGCAAHIATAAPHRCRPCWCHREPAPPTGGRHRAVCHSTVFSQHRVFKENRRCPHDFVQRSHAVAGARSAAANAGRALQHPCQLGSSPRHPPGLHRVVVKYMSGAVRFVRAWQHQISGCTTGWAHCAEGNATCCIVSHHQ